MSLREAAEQALKHLDSVSDWDTTYPIGKAKEALRQTLAQPVDAVNRTQERVDETVKREHDRAVELAQAYERGWNAALAQPEQEPVAWIHDGGKGELWWYRSSKFDEEGNLIGDNPDDVPLYTAPPKREWVGLTADELNMIVDKMQTWNNYTLTDVYYGIEAKLKEKNNG